MATRSLDVRENVERALGQPAGKTFDLVKTGDHNVAPFLELGAHRLDRVLRSAERLDPGDLREAGGAGVRVSHQAGDVRREIGAHHAVTHPPASHGVGLGETVEQNAALLHSVDRHDGVMFTFENEAAIDLVGQHHDVAIADRARDAVDVVLFSTPPVGFCGEFRMINFVRSLISPASSSTSSRKSISSRNRIGTAFAPT